MVTFAVILCFGLVSPATTQRVWLDAATSRIDFQAVPLSDAVQFFVDITSANIHVNWPALEAQGVSRTTPVTLQHDASTLRVVLDLVLQQAGGAGRSLMLAEDDGVIVITTAADDPEFRAREPSFVRGDPEGVKKTRDALDRAIPKVDLNAVTTTQAVDFLQGASGIAISVNWTVLERAGIGSLGPVTIQMHDISLNRCIRLLADQMSTPTQRVRYAIDGKRIVISTRDDLLKK